MKYFFWLFCFPLFSQAQTSFESASGNIVFPPILKLNITHQSPFVMSFVSWQDFLEPKIFPAVLQLNVKSTRPWILSVAASSQYFTSGPDGSPNMPVSLLSLRKAPDGLFLALSSAYQSIIQNENNLIYNNYTFDFRMDVPWNYKGDRYHTQVIFSISQQ